MAIMFLWVLLKHMLVNHLKKNYVSEKVTIFFFFLTTFSISHKKFLKNVIFFLHGRLVQWHSHSTQNKMEYYSL